MSTEPMVTRTLRAAVKIGDDYYTIEETIALSPGATDAQIAQAVETGLRIYEAQRQAAEQQLRTLREQARPGATAPAADVPASDRQRAYLDRIIVELNWPLERVADFAQGAYQIDLATMTKDQASRVIDQLIAIRDGKREAPAWDAPPTPIEQAVAAAPAATPATSRQVRALEQLFQTRDIDAYHGRPFPELSLDEAGTLIAEWMRRPRRLRQAETEDLPF